MKTIEQRRAADALACVERLIARPDEFPDEFRERYRACVDRLGPAIVMNGLGQALATECAAAGPQPKDARERAHRQLYDNLRGWLCRDGGGAYPPGGDLLQAIVAGDEPRYLRAQAEALAWLRWHKKFCRASLPKGEGDDG